MDGPVTRTVRSVTAVMIIATVLALLPVVIVVGIAIHELSPWCRQLRDIRALPEASSREGENECAI
jgi:hypothetical protein